MCRGTIILALALAIAPAAPWAGPLEDGFAAYEAGDYPAALRWFRMAAEQGDAAAQLNLGFMYAKGQGVPQDYVQAHLWLNLAAAQGDQDAQERRDILARLMTPTQIAEAQRLARE
jgi:TPR repeat protein